MTRSIEALAARTFDTVVIGGGIYGLTIACDAAQRGLSVALIERDDFGSATSFNHLRTIHGGLRYLQTLDFARARESIRERRTLALIAPWALRPLPFVLPLFPSLARGRIALRVGFLLDSLVAGDRDDGLPESHRLPGGRVLGPSEAKATYPELRSLDITGAAVWYDYVTVEADRLTLAWALSAVDHGAVVANRVEALEIASDKGRTAGVRARDRLTGSECLIAGRTVVNATGGGINRLLEPIRASVRLPLLQAVNVVTTYPAPAAAFGGRGASGRTLFLVPWQGRAVFGTWESPGLCTPDDLTISRSTLTDFLQDLNVAFPAYELTPDTVSLVHRGVVPARARPGQRPALDGRELIFEHRPPGPDGLVSVAGTKYTTARAVAEHVVDRVFAYLGRSPVPCRSAQIPLPHVALDGDALLRYAAAHEMVVTLADAVMRRTTIGAVGCPDEPTLQHAAAVVGGVLGWSSERQREEIEGVRAMY
jgi:glycerol-3-phosphate dehydrogenase